MKDQINNIIDQTIQSINQTTELFYQQKIKDGFSNLKNTIELINISANLMYQYAEANDVVIGVNDLNQILISALSALEDNDVVLFSDILQYDIKSLLEDILLQIK